MLRLQNEQYGDDGWWKLEFLITSGKQRKIRKGYFIDPKAQNSQKLFTLLISGFWGGLEMETRYVETWS